MRIDLHVHSTASDGALSPTALVEEARARNIQVVALTDHDTMDGVAEAQAAAERMGIELIAGVELNTDSPAGEVHVLGYYIPLENQAFQELLANRRRARVVRAHKMVERLRTLGMTIEYADVERFAGQGAVGRPHVARALVAAGYAADVREAFDRWIYTGGPAYVKRESFSPTEAVAAVREAGGVPVLAHPGRIRDQSVIPELIEAGLEGLECYYPEHTPQQTEHYAALAREHDLVVTGGTDFHGPGSPHKTQLGSVPVPPSAVRELAERRGRR